MTYVMIRMLNATEFNSAVIEPVHSVWLHLSLIMMIVDVFLH